MKNEKVEKILREMVANIDDEDKILLFEDPWVEDVWAFRIMKHGKPYMDGIAYLNDHPPDFEGDVGDFFDEWPPVPEMPRKGLGWLMGG